MKRKLLLVGPYPPPYGGQSVAFKLLIDKIKKDRHYEYELINILSKRLMGNRFVLQAFNYIKRYFSFIFKLVTFKPKIVYLIAGQSRNSFVRDIPFILLSSLFGKKIIVHIHGGNFGSFYNEENNSFKFIIEFVYKRVDRIIVLSSKLKNMFPFISDKSKLVTIKNGIVDDCNIPRTSPIKDNLRLLYLSNIMETKGVFNVIDAAIELHESKSINVSLDIAGDFVIDTSPNVPTSYKNVESLKTAFYKKNKNMDFIKYHGVVLGEDKEKLLLNTDVILLPSHFSAEGQPMSLIEGLKYGLAIITTNYRANGDMVKDNGFFVEFNNTGDIINAVQSIVANPELLLEFSKNSRDLYEKHFDYDVHYQNMNEVFNTFF